MENGNRGSAIGNPVHSTSARQDESPRYQQLDAWQLTDDLAVAIYQLIDGLPPKARVLTSQLIRAATSPPANIAEGYGRASRKEFQQFLTIAHASLYELGYFVHFLGRVQAIDQNTQRALSGRCQRASRVLYGLMRSVSTGAKRDSEHRRYLKEEAASYGPGEFAIDE